MISGSDSIPLQYKCAGSSIDSGEMNNVVVETSVEEQRKVTHVQVHLPLKIWRVKVSLHLILT
jgi:hypothetical protein